MSECVVRRLDGQGPRNGYLWPTEAWWPSHDPQFGARLDSQFHFGVVALADGRWSVHGVVMNIEANRDELYPSPGQVVRPVVFESRTAAIRTAAARMLFLAWGARFWENSPWYKMTNSLFSELYAWTLKKVAEETEGVVGRCVWLPDPAPPPPPGPEAGLELWEGAVREGAGQDVRKAGLL